MGLIVAALVAVAGFMAGIGSFRLLAQVSCLRSDPHLYFISPVMDGLVILACLALAWLIAYFQKDVLAIRYVGVRFYGHTLNEQGMVSTKWLTFFFPLVPVRSYYVDTGKSAGPVTEIELLHSSAPPVPGGLYFPQVLRTALISYGTLLWCWGCLWLMLNSHCLKIGV